MDILEIMKQRHSVRTYNDKPIEPQKVQNLNSIITDINSESGLSFELVTNDKEAFNSALAHYGKFNNVNNYILLKGKNDKLFQEKCGYFGEKLVLEATKLGLATCWVYLTMNKKYCKTKLNSGEKLCCVISIGYADNTSNPHKVKPISALTNVKDSIPWFERGMTACQIAPTATNQQKFFVTLDSNKNTKISIKGIGFCTKIDLGIVKCHFELASEKKVNRDY